jgi:hypothetical protein
MIVIKSLLLGFLWGIAFLLISALLVNFAGIIFISGCSHLGVNLSQTYLRNMANTCVVMQILCGGVGFIFGASRCFSINKATTADEKLTRG